jgi:hypothetical protein
MHQDGAQPVAGKQQQWGLEQELSQFDKNVRPK